MKIVLICNAGMSTSVLVKRMCDVAAQKGLEADIQAYSVEVLEEVLEKEAVDCVLVGPQIRHMRPNIEKICAQKCPVDLIDMRDYGMINGAAVLDKALSMINK